MSGYMCDGNHGLREDLHGLMQDAQNGDGSKSQCVCNHHLQTNAHRKDGNAGQDER